ncbi:hypothetical protein RclHR1_00810022 [Rhizophagus clarus]|uniref:F-box domain-containing protein n=1 Tax=Rhizophagus clarus TaxID=94130 RepID=A0A2Z6SEA0_9GLOM|nr:hypothetical protein RclHR1_00810022 [Rhizophagus clarus]
MEVDCLLEVLNYLRNEYSTLYSCSLVNKLWCHQTVPILWYKPFNDEMTEKKSLTIIRTCLSCLEGDEIQELFNQENIRLSFYDLKRKPLFDYPKYLRNFHVYNFRLAFKLWFSDNLPEINNDLLKFEILYQRLINLIFKRTKGFKILSIQPDNYYNNWLNYSSLIQNEISIKYLQKFYFKYEVKQGADLFVKELSELFNLLIRYVNNLRHLNVSINFGNKLRYSSQVAILLSQLIESQKNLEILEINDFWDPRKFSPIFDAIKSQKNSLKYLRLEGLKNFEPLLNILIYCNNLEILNLKSFAQMEENINIKSINNIINLSELNIKHLYSWDIPSFLDADDMGLLLKLINHSLNTLAIDRVIDNNLLEIIKDYCPNIQNLSLGMFNASFPDILPSLLNNLSLNHLYLDIFGYNFSDVLIELTNSIPSSVNSLYLNFTLFPHQLDYFLNEMKSKPKILGIIDKNMIKNDHLEVIIKYAKNHDNLKELHWFGNLDDEIIKVNMNEARSIIPLICFPSYNFLDSKINLKRYIH